MIRPTSDGLVAVLSAPTSVPARCLTPLVYDAPALLKFGRDTAAFMVVKESH
jgi:hypothetical protein